MVGLLMIYQLIDAWQRGKQWLSHSVRWLRKGPPSTSMAPLSRARHLRGRLLLALFVFQIGFGTTFAFTHRSNLVEDVASIAGAAQNLCRSVRLF